MLDLFAIADTNGPAVEAEFESALSAVGDQDASLLREFAHWVQERALISINVRLYLVVELVNGGQYQNTYEWCREQARLSGHPAEDFLRRRLRSFYDRRVAFDRTFTNGEDFRFGALNAGGVGLADYGAYCLVLSQSFQNAHRQFAYLPGDSLTLCCSADGRLDNRAVEGLCVPHSHRHQMVALHRKSPVLVAPREDWPGHVLSGSEYFEAIFVGDINLAAVGCVRVSRAEFDRTWDLAFFGSKTTEAERALLHDFIQLLRAREAGTLELEVVT